MEYLIPWSGGLDSTALILNAMSDESSMDMLHTFYVDVGSEKAWCENNSIAMLKHVIHHHPYWSEWFDFDDSWHHSNTKTELPLLDDNAGMAQPVLWMQNALMHLSGIRVHCSNVRVQFGYTNDDSAAQYIDHLQELWAAMWRVVMIGTNPIPFETPLIEMTKGEVFANFISEQKRLDLKLLGMIWTCETPMGTNRVGFNGYESCGECRPCVQQRGAVQLFANNSRINNG